MMKNLGIAIINAIYISSLSWLLIGPHAYPFRGSRPWKVPWSEMGMAKTMVVEWCYLNGFYIGFNGFNGFNMYIYIFIILLY